MALRNFWIDVNVDGRSTDLEGGPRSKDGGMYVSLYQRKDGQKVTAMTVNCWADGDKLFTDVYIDGEFCGQFETER